MKCPVCASKSGTLEVRTNKDESKRRRYQCLKGHRFSTREVIFEDQICEKQEAIRDSSKPQLSTLWPLSVASVSL